MITIIIILYCVDLILTLQNTYLLKDRLVFSIKHNIQQRYHKQSHLSMHHTFYF